LPVHSLNPDSTVATLSFRHLYALATAVATVVGCSRDGPILVGLAGPFSQDRATSMLQAAELAVREINGRGGIRGRPLQLVVLDDSANADVTLRVAQELYDNSNVIAVVGHLTSSSTLAAAPVYGSGTNPIVQISPSASSPLITDAGPHTFRVCPSDLVHGSRLAEWARAQLGAERAAILYQNDDYGRAVRATFASSFLELGGSIVSEDPYVDEIPSFGPFLQRLRQRGGADVLLVAGTRASGSRIAATLDTVGISVRILAGDGLVGIGQTTMAEGVVISTAYLPDRPGNRNSDFVRAYRAAYRNELPDYRGAGTYDILYLLAQAMETVGPDRGPIRDYLARVGRDIQPFEGVTGPIAFDENGDVPEKDVIIGVISDGRLTTAVGQ
jgi:branched-chain amino acid transport system substrate-binding protein